jgi:mono/diheme cytochrome c family protein
MGSGSRNFNRGSNLGTPESKRGPARLLAFKLGAKTPFPMPRVIVPDVPRPAAQTFSAEVIKTGAELYRKDFCAGCHAPEADGSGAWAMDDAIPDLRYMPPSAHLQWDAIVMKGIRARNGMPGFENPPSFPIVTKKMTQQEANAIHAYVIDLQWKAFNADQERLKASTKR